MFGFILSIIFFIISFVTLFRVVKYGKSLLFPNFERVDRMFGEKHRVVTNWNTTFGKIVYYVFMLLGLFFLSVAIFNIVA